jgi:alpha-ketoglutarate-dependent taurine dioxygenase
VQATLSPLPRDAAPEDAAARLAVDGAVVLEGVDVRADAELLAACAFAGAPSPVGNGGAVVFDVTPRPDGTDLSSTAAAFPVHTDSTFLPEPHVAIALGCVEASGTGGRSCVVRARDACAAVPDDVVDALSEAVFPFIVRDGVHPARVDVLPVVTWDAAGDPLLRFRFDAIAMAGRAGEIRLSDRHAAALDVFRAAVEDEALQATFALRPGDVLVVDNRRALHGRSAVGPDAGRLMRRVKLDGPGAAPVGDGRR